ncbi:MAG: hypothetical protein KDA60_04710 [Planctomycetales bacterium]|nr:hypothetical protein [Planctomycetales bacterium]
MPNFTFKPLESGYEVSLRGKKLGSILPTKETTGRHCFILGHDARKTPRTYRGRIKAAEALLEIDKLKAEAKKKKLDIDQVIIRAWDIKPRASDQWK